MKPTFIALLALCLCLPLVGADKKKPLPKDLKSLKALAEKGDARAQLSLGHIYWYGRGVLKDDKEAVRWYRLAAAQAHVASVGRDPKTLQLAHVQFTHIVESGDRGKCLEIQRPHFEFAMGTHRDWDHLQACYLTGTIEDMCETIADLKGVGLQHLIIHPTSTEPEQIDLIAKHFFPLFKD